MLALYLQGLAVLILGIAYPIIFCWASEKLTGDNLCDGEYGFLGGCVLAYIFPLTIALILFIPYIIGIELFGG